MTIRNAALSIPARRIAPLLLVAVALLLVVPSGAALAKRPGAKAAPKAAAAASVPAATALRSHPEDELVALLLGDFLSTRHYAPNTDGSLVAPLWLDGYLDQLDPNRMFFLAGDVEAIRAKWGPELAKQYTDGKPLIAPGLDIYDAWRGRVAERLTLVDALLDKPQDFTLDESWAPDREELPWPATTADANELWRLQVKDQLLVGQLRGRPAKEHRKLLHKRYANQLDRVQESDSLDVLEIWFSALAAAYDPHSAYFKPATEADFEIQISNSVEGIGAVLRPEDEYTVVERLVAGGPAEMDGRIKPGDRIVAVAQGRKSEAVDIVDMRLDKVVALIRGKKGSPVLLTVIPAGVKDISRTRVIRLIRDKVVLTESDADAEVRSIPRAAGGEPLNLAVLDLPSFYIGGQEGAGGRAHGSSQDVRRLLGELRQKKVDGLVLDLRHNGGGSLSEAIDIAGLFIDRGPVVQVRDGEGNVMVLNDKAAGSEFDGPVVVLTSPLSASASEIVAGALQDYGRAVVVGGATTHGKGTVQQLASLARMVEMMTGGNQVTRAGSLKMTTQQFYLPAGQSTQLHGVVSDIVLPSPYDHLGISEAELERALPGGVVAPSQFSPAARLQDRFDALRQRSAERVAADERFIELSALLQERVALRAQMTVSLNLEQRKRERDERDERTGVDSTERDEAEQSAGSDAEGAEGDAEDAGQAGGDAKPKELDPVLDEALLILRDLVELSAV